MPDPPMSMESVTGDEMVREARGTAFGVGAAAMEFSGPI